MLPQLHESYDLILVFKDKRLYVSIGVGDEKAE